MKRKKEGWNVSRTARKIGHIVFAGGIVLVAIFTLISPPLALDPKYALTLLALGLVVGIIDVRREQAVPFLLAFIGLIITSNAPLHMIETYNIGVYLMSFFKNTALFLSLAVGVVSVRVVYRIYKESV